MPGGLAAAIILPHMFNRVNEEIRYRVEARFASHYSQLDVSVRSAELVEGVGIEIRGMMLSERTPIAAEGIDVRAEQEGDSPLVYLERATFECPTELTELVRQEVDVRKITIHRPTFRFTRRLDGSWNSAELMPFPDFGGCHPEVVIEGGTIEIVDQQKNPPGLYVLRDFNLHMAAPAQLAGGPRELRGTLTGDYLRRIEFTGRFDPDTSKWDIGGVIEGLEISPELGAAVPSPVTEGLRKRLGTFRGRGQFGFRVQSGDTAERTLIYQVSGDIDEGRLDDRRLPYPLTNISAAVCCNNDGFSVQNLSARSGRTTLRLSGKMAGFTEDSPWQLEAEIENLKLERSLTAGLPVKLQELWTKYSPVGDLQLVKMKLQADASGFRSDLADVHVDCGDVSFSYAKFPYELEHAHGAFELRQGVVLTALTAYTAGLPVEVKAEVAGAITPSEGEAAPSGWCEIRAAKIPLDAKLTAAIGVFDAESRATLHRLDPHGSVGFYARIWRDAADAEPKKHFIIALGGCSMQFERFPYPIRDIRGTIERYADGSWSIREVEGSNDTARITCAGSLTDTPQGKLLSLAMAAADVPLDKQLRDALPAGMQRFWDDAKPRGIVNLEEIKIDWFAGEKTLGLSVACRPRGDTVSIEPKVFPYRLENIEGRMLYRNGHVDLERFRARHGQAEMSATGYCEFPQEGGWHFHLDGVSVDRLVLDRELVQALPGRLRAGILELNPAGHMYLCDGSLDLVQGGAAGDPVRSGWRVTLGFHQGSVDCGVKLHDMHGNLTMAGWFDGKHYSSQGELDVDSLMYKDIQLTQVMGPLWIDDRNILLGYAKSDGGQAAEAPPGSRPITAKVFGGTLAGECRVELGGAPHYNLQARLSGADLALCAKETMAGQHRLKGKVFASVGLRGTGRSLNSMQGRGEIKLREADVYELPLMISLLKLLSIREPDSNAFSEGDMRFYIGGNHVYFNPINFSGDAISLRGNGEMDFQSNVNLKFYTVVGRDKWRVPVISPVLSGASQQALVINVTGPLSNPHMTRDILPLAKEALQQLQADLRGMNILPPPSEGNQPPAAPPSNQPWALPPVQSAQEQQPVRSSTRQ